jgi:5-methylcytosine-specific restriction endonuclease McrA
MRQEFSKKTKLARFEFARGHCEYCGAKIITHAEYHHERQAHLGGDNSLENCRCICVKCHNAESRKNRPENDKTRRVYEKRAGVRKTRGFAANRNGKYKQKMDGTVERR